MKRLIAIERFSMSLAWILAVAWMVLPIQSAGGAYFEYEDGAFVGRRGLRMTFGQPERISAEDPPGTIIHETFMAGADVVGDLGFTVTVGPNGLVVSGENPEDPLDDGALEMFDPGDDAVTIGKIVVPLDILHIEFDYLFETAGVLKIILGRQVLTTIHSEGSSGFTYFDESFIIADYWVDIGEAMMLELRLTNPGARDPQMYLDNLLVSTVVPEPAGLCLLLAGGVALIRLRRR